MSKPRYRWFESHGAWLLVRSSPLRHSHFPTWLFPKGFRW